jgi:hypothetical protein
MQLKKKTFIGEMIETAGWNGYSRMKIKQRRMKIYFFATTRPTMLTIIDG